MKCINIICLCSNAERKYFTCLYLAIQEIKILTISVCHLQNIVQFIAILEKVARRRDK